jgi:hypothetical protein
MKTAILAVVFAAAGCESFQHAPDESTWNAGNPLGDQFQTRDEINDARAKSYEAYQASLKK